MRFILSLAAVVPCSLMAMYVSTDSIFNSPCSYNDGRIYITPSGGTGPYTYAWDDGPTIEDRTGLAPGSYGVTVTDFVGATATGSWSIYLTDLGQPLNSFIIDGQGFNPCPGQHNGSVLYAAHYLNGIPPYNVSMQVSGVSLDLAGYDQHGDPYFSGVGNGDQVDVYINDQGGCTGQFSFMVSGPLGVPATVQANGACAGQANGSALIIPSQEMLDWSGGGGFKVINDLTQQIAFNIPYYPNDSIMVPGLAAGDYTIYPTAPVVAGCYTAGQFTIPDLGSTCGNISGTVFIDHDQNCAQDAGDVGLPERLLTIGPGPDYAITDANGHYSRNLLPGDFDISLNDADLLQLCPGTSPVPFTISSGTPLVNIDLADSSLAPLDLLASLVGLSPARPGFEFVTWLRVVNTSGQLSGPLTGSFTFDPTFTYVDAYPAPANVSGNVITWSMGALGSFASPYFSVTLSVPPDPGLIGSTFPLFFTSSQPLTETSLTNNDVLIDVTVQGSYDPNVKTVEPRDVYLIDQDSTLTYTICFQNTGTDTAFTVVVTDTLDALLDIGTLQLLGASHAYIPQLDDPRVLRFTFNNINLPDSGTNETLSHGALSFRIRPHASLQPGDVISNTANIFFDLNPPVITEPSVLTAEFSTTVGGRSTSTEFRVFPNPAVDRLFIETLDAGSVSVVRVLAVDGRIVLQGSMVGRRTVLDIGALGTGAYIIELQHADGARSAQRFTKE